MDGKTYKKKITVKGYTNPVKSLVLTGVSSKNLKSYFAKNYYNDMNLSKKAKAGYMKVSAASGWKIKSAWWEDGAAGQQYEFYCFGDNSASSVNLKIPAMKKAGKYYANMRFINTTTGGEQYIHLNIGE